MLAMKFTDYFFIAVFACIFLFFAVKILTSDNGSGGQDTEDSESESELSPELIAKDAVAVKKTYGFGHGTKSYNFRTNFFITFRLDDGSEIEYPVTEELFQRTSENQRGTLVTVNGNFFDFGDGEDIDPENTDI